MQTRSLLLAMAAAAASSVSAQNSGAEGTPKDMLYAQLASLPTQVERIKALNDTQFVFNFLDPTAERTKGAAGYIVSANAATFPALYSHGMAMALGVLGPCSMNSPHTHPRATEFNVALNGTLHTGMLAENGARFVVNDVGTLSATFFPKGAIHFEANLGCDPVYFIAAFNDPDPGVLQVAQRFYGLPPDVVGQSLGGVGVEEVVTVAHMIPDNIIFAADECFKRCGIYKPASQPVAQQQPRVPGNAFPSTGGSGAPAPAAPAPAAPAPAAPAPAAPASGMGSTAWYGAPASGSGSAPASGGSMSYPYGKPMKMKRSFEALVAPTPEGGRSNHLQILIAGLLAINGVLVLGIAYLLRLKRRTVAVVVPAGAAYMDEVDAKVARF